MIAWLLDYQVYYKSYIIGPTSLAIGSVHKFSMSDSGIVKSTGPSCFTVGALSTHVQHVWQLDHQVHRPRRSDNWIVKYPGPEGLIMGTSSPQVHHVLQLER